MAAPGRRPPVVGLTGRIACGKSQAARFLTQLGCHVIDADKLGHASYEPGTECFRSIVAAFGDQVVAEDGTINRGVLGGIVFSDPAQMAKLNALVWPHIRKSVDAEVARAAGDGAEAIVVEAAVLLDAGWDTSCDHVWIVTASPDVAKARLMARNGLSEGEALKRINSQSDRRPERAVMINNDGGLADLAKQVKALYQRHLCPVAGGVDEVVMQVDEDNKPVGDVARSEVRAKTLWHRATYIVIKNSKDQLYVQKRTWIKDYCPGAFDPVTGGVVAAGEEYPLSAEREAEEEMGVSGVPLDFLFTFKYTDERTRVWGGMFECRWDKPAVPQLSEVEAVELMSLEDVRRRAAAGQQFAPDSLYALDLYERFKRGQPMPAGAVVRPVARPAAVAASPAAACSRLVTAQRRRTLCVSLLAAAAIGIAASCWGARSSASGSANADASR